MSYSLDSYHIDKHITKEPLPPVCDRCQEVFTEGIEFNAAHTWHTICEDCIPDEIENNAILLSQHHNGEKVNDTLLTIAAHFFREILNIT